MERYEYSYEDDIVKREITDPITGNPTWSITTKNRHLFNKPSQDTRIEFDSSTGKAIVYSTEPIPGMTLIKQEKGQTPKKNRLIPEEVNALEVTP